MVQMHHLIIPQRDQRLPAWVFHAVVDCYAAPAHARASMTSGMRLRSLCWVTLLQFWAMWNNGHRTWPHPPTNTGEVLDLLKKSIGWEPARSVV